MAKKCDVSEQTIDTWRKRCCELEAVDVKKLRKIEQKDAKLKKRLAEHDVEIDGIEGGRQNRMASAAVRRKQVA